MILPITYFSNTVDRFFFSSFKCGNGSRITSPPKKTHIQNIRYIQGLKEVDKKYCRVHMKELATAAIYSILQSIQMSH
jgi:hypothetical protein